MTPIRLGRTVVTQHLARLVEVGFRCGSPMGPAHRILARIAVHFFQQQQRSSCSLVIGYWCLLLTVAVNSPIQSDEALVPDLHVKYGS